MLKKHKIFAQEQNNNHTMESHQTINPIRSGLFQTVNDPGGGGGFKSPPPLRSRKLLCQSSHYDTCKFYQVFLT